MQVVPTPIRPELEQEIRQELSSDERLLWVGVPRPWATTQGYWGLAAMGGVFTVFATFMIVWHVAGAAAASQTPAPGSSGSSGLMHAWGSYLSVFTLFGLFFLVIGLWFASGPFRIRRGEHRTAYALTDRRAIIIEGASPGRRRAVTSYAGSRLARFHRMDKPDGYGDIVFESIQIASGENGPVYRPRGFLGVPDAQKIDGLIREVAGPEP